MSNESTFRARQYLPQVVVATMLVVVLPVVVVWLLLVEGVISSPWVSVGLAMALSLSASAAGNAYWKRRSGQGDLLFSEILLWGWLRRLRNERRLAAAVGSLGLTGAEAASGGSAQRADAQTLRQMAVALDAQDPYTDGHSRRVALHAAMIARMMGMSREEVAQVQMAAAVHDVGKLRIPVDVLNKPTTLTAAEFEIVKHHVDDGAEIVSGLGDPALVAMVRHHHERFDGTGYPAGFVGEESPVGARVIAVADTFDALTSARPYRRAIPHKQALEIIRSASGTQLDPVAVRAFLKCYSGKRAIALWTALLVASPQRALAMFGGKHAPRTSPGSAAVTIAMPAALAAVVAAAIGTAGTLGSRPDPARFAQRGSPPVTATAASTGSHHHSGKSRDPAHARSASTRAREATAGVLLASAGSLGAFGASGGGTGGGSGSGAGTGGSGGG
ncbi:MAG TPA: HD-GYP domain-containing protein, partial [Solirubrobacteraceae bacterium]